VHTQQEKATHGAHPAGRRYTLWYTSRKEVHPVVHQQERCYPRCTAGGMLPAVYGRREEGRQCSTGRGEEGRQCSTGREEAGYIPLGRVRGSYHTSSRSILPPPGTTQHPAAPPVLPARQCRLHRCHTTKPWALDLNPSWVEVSGTSRSPLSCYILTVLITSASRLLLEI